MCIVNSRATTKIFLSIIDTLRGDKWNYKNERKQERGIPLYKKIGRLTLFYSKQKQVE